MRRQDAKRLTTEGQTGKAKYGGKQNRPVRMPAVLAAVTAAAMLLSACGVQNSSGNAAGGDGAETAVSGTETEAAESAGSAAAGASAEGAETASSGTSNGGAGEDADTAGSKDAAQGGTLPDEDTRSMAELYPDIDFSGLPRVTRDEYPQVDGSTACLPLSYALYRAVTGATQVEAESRITCSRTDNSYMNIAESDYEYAAKLVLAYKPSEKMQQEIDENGAPLDVKPVGKDALVFIENAGNPVKSLTEEELVGIYSGKITNWSQVGGKDLPIKAFQRPQGSGSQTLMNSFVMKGTAMAAAPSYMVPSAMGELIRNVSFYTNTENAIGYSVYFYARNMESRPGLRFLAVDKVVPSNKTIADGSYPYVNDFYAVVRKDEPADSVAHQIYDWLTGTEGQKLIAALGYVSLDGSESAGETDILPELQRGTAQYTLPAGGYIILNGPDTLNRDGIYICDGRMEEVKHIEGVTASQTIAVQSLKVPVVAIENATGRYGLLDPDKEEWILPPVFNNISSETFGGKTMITAGYYPSDTQPVVDDGFYRGDPGAEAGVTGSDGAASPEGGDTSDGAYGIATRADAPHPDKEGEYLYNGKDLVYIGTGGYDRLGDRIVSFDTDYDNLTCSMRVLNQDGTVESEQDLTADPGLVSAWCSGKYLYGTDVDGDTRIYNARLEPVFLPDMLKDSLDTICGSSMGAQRTISAYGISRDGALVNGEITDGEGGYASFLYDRKTGKLLSGTGDDVQNDVANDAGDIGYTVTKPDGTRLVYLDGDEPLKASDGTPFQYILGRDYYGYYESYDSYESTARFHVESRNGSERYVYTAQTPADDSGIYFSPVRAVAKGCFLVTESDSSTALWKADDCLIHNGSAYDNVVADDYVAVSDADNKTLLLKRSDGGIMLRTQDEYITSVVGPVVCTGTMNFHYFKTLDGKTVLKVLDAYSALD